MRVTGGIEPGRTEAVIGGDRRVPAEETLNDTKVICVSQSPGSCISMQLLAYCLVVVVFPHRFGPTICTAPNTSGFNFISTRQIIYWQDGSVQP